MAGSGRQLGFDLHPADPYRLDYFISHSGASEATTVLERNLAELLEDRSRFSCTYLYGPEGSGKTHLVEGVRARALQSGIAAEQIDIVCLEGKPVDTDEFAAGFISRYERLRSAGGMLLLTARAVPQELCSNPHVLSRLKAACAIRLKYPQEEELRPILASLLERRNLKLSEKSVEYLLRRLPLDPLSFDRIFAKIDGFCLSQGKPARFGVVRDMLERSDEG